MPIVIAAEDRQQSVFQLFISYDAINFNEKCAIIRNYLIDDFTYFIDLL
jgi:hypothetical protein